MKIDRLLSIVMHLMSRDLVNASELAERFGTTVRTIQRDVDSINRAGISLAFKWFSWYLLAWCRTRKDFTHQSRCAEE
ncbi:MAG TPA: HTH domain-containing protein [Spirochaetia bacterium]|nr:HTH domain-containing protein [Spirochaetia bacterium]